MPRASVMSLSDNLGDHQRQGHEFSGTTEHLWKIHEARKYKSDDDMAEGKEKGFVQCDFA